MPGLTCDDRKRLSLPQIAVPGSARPAAAKILNTQPDRTKICVTNIGPLRFATGGGQEKYEQVFQGLNTAVTAAARGGDIAIS